MLQVTNSNNFDLIDRYDGRDYIFPAGATVALGEDAAKHIFGFGDVDKSTYLARLGWVRNSGEVEAGMQKLNGFSFSSYETPSPGEIIPPDPDAAIVEQAVPKYKGSILDKLGANA